MLDRYEGPNDLQLPTVDFRSQTTSQADLRDMFSARQSKQYRDDRTSAQFSPIGNFLNENGLLIDHRNVEIEATSNR